jgi:hypothetical protein
MLVPLLFDFVWCGKPVIMDLQLREVGNGLTGSKKSAVQPRLPIGTIPRAALAVTSEEVR